MGCLYLHICIMCIYAVYVFPLCLYTGFGRVLCIQGMGVERYLQQHRTDQVSPKTQIIDHTTDQDSHTTTHTLSLATAL